jgi:signal transduction histidine kinase
MRWSIRCQLLVPLLTMLLGVVGMAVWTGMASAERARRQIETQMHDIARTVNAATFPRNPQTLSLMKGLSGAEFLLCDSHRRPLLDDRGEPMATLAGMPAELPDPTDDWQDWHLGPRVAMAGDTYLCQGIRLGREQTWILYIFYPESLWRDAQWAAVRPSLFLGVAGGLGSILLTVLVGQRLSRRIQELERRTRLIAAGDFGPMPLPTADDELRDLARSVNEMAQQLAQLQETIKKTERLRLLGQVSGGLAHQLRNGVTGARLALQLHAREINGQADADQADAETLSVALRQLALLEIHLKRFLDLGRAAEFRRQPCLVTELLDETVGLLRPQCQHAHIDLRWQPPQLDKAPSVLGDRDQLQHLFLNVIGNAVEAAGINGWVLVELTRARFAGGREGALIQVSDSGPGPAPAVAARLFEPFVTGKPEGVGLGLAVARQVAEGHGGTISWRRESDHTCFRIELPLQEADIPQAISASTAASLGVSA